MRRLMVLLGKRTIAATASLYIIMAFFTAAGLTKLSTLY